MINKNKIKKLVFKIPLNKTDYPITLKDCNNNEVIVKYAKKYHRCKIV